MHSGTFGLYGNPGPSKSFTLTDAAQSLDDLFSSNYLDGNQPPIAFFISVETNGMRLAFNGGDGFHVVPKNQSARFANPDMVKTAQLKNATPGSNATVVITLEY